MRQTLLNKIQLARKHGIPEPTLNKYAPELDLNTRALEPALNKRAT